MARAHPHAADAWFDATVDGSLREGTAAAAGTATAAGAARTRRRKLESLPHGSRPRPAERWLASASPGFCAATGIRTGDSSCGKGSGSCDPRLGCNRAPSTCRSRAAAHGLQPQAVACDCVSSASGYISISLRMRDCSWFERCDSAPVPGATLAAQGAPHQGSGLHLHRGWSSLGFRSGAAGSTCTYHAYQAAHAPTMPTRQELARRRRRPGRRRPRPEKQHALPGGGGQERGAVENAAAVGVRIAQRVQPEQRPAFPPARRPSSPDSKGNPSKPGWPPVGQRRLYASHSWRVQATSRADRDDSCASDAKVDGRAAPGERGRVGSTAPAALYHRPWTSSGPTGSRLPRASTSRPTGAATERELGRGRGGAAALAASRMGAPGAPKRCAFGGRVCIILARLSRRLSTLFTLRLLPTLPYKNGVVLIGKNTATVTRGPATAKGGCGTACSPAMVGAGPRSRRREGDTCRRQDGEPQLPNGRAEGGGPRGGAHKNIPPPTPHPSGLVRGVRQRRGAP